MTGVGRTSSWARLSLGSVLYEAQRVHVLLAADFVQLNHEPWREHGNRGHGAPGPEQKTGRHRRVISLKQPEIVTILPDLIPN